MSFGGRRSPVISSGFAIRRIAYVAILSLLKSHLVHELKRLYSNSVRNENSEQPVFILYSKIKNTCSGKIISYQLLMGLG